MRIDCTNGFYKFYPDGINELTIFSEIFGIDLVHMGDFYTFKQLAELPDYSIKGQIFGGIVASKNYAGTPWDVFSQNGLKFNIEKGIITTNDMIESVGERVTGYNWIITGIPPAFAQLSDKTIIKGFQGFVNVIENYTVVYRWQNENI